jgi:ATP-binding cassette, subfamily B, bacterial CvaB/MchF/RaxB
VFQRGRFDCGPAALRMMLLQLGKDIPLDSLEHRALDTPTGTSVGRMVQILIAQGVPTHAAKLPLGEWKRLPPPYISLYDGNHFLLVASKVGDGYEILDPALGRGLISAAKLYHLSQGIVIAPNGFQAS